MDFLQLIIDGMDTFFLVLVRMTALFVIAPFFGRRNIPAYLKVGFAFFSSIIVLTTVNLNIVEYSNMVEFALLIAEEFLVGIALGFSVYIMLNAIYVAGQMIDMQIGFGMVNVINPDSNIQVPITANFYYIVSILTFLVFRGHHMVIKALYESYRFVPIGEAVAGEELLSDIIRLFGNIFVIGFKIAAPITAAILMANVALGVMSKAVPQLNVFVLGMPIKIMLGMIVMLVTMPVFIDMLEELFSGTAGEMLNMLEDLGP